MKTHAIHILCFASVSALACEKAPDDDARTAIEVAAAEEATELLQAAQVDAARLDVDRLSDAVVLYIVSELSAPESLDVLESEGYVESGRFLQGDPWGNPYVYEPVGGSEFRLYSAGPNGVPGDDDDVYSEAR